MHSIAELIPWMKRAGFAATALSALITSAFGWELGETLLVSLALAGLLSLVTFCVGYSLVAAHHAFKAGDYVATGAAVVLFAVAVAVEFLSHVGFTAANRDASVQNAAFQTTTFSDKRAAVKQLTSDVERIQKKIEMLEGTSVNGKPLSTPEALQGEIDRLRTNTRFLTMTDDCNRTRGPQTRAFCNELKAAEAGKAMAGELLQLREELPLKQRELAEARQAAATSKAGHSAGASQSVILASLATFDTRPDEQKQFWSGIGISALLAIFAIVAGGLINYLAYAFDGAAAAAREVSKAALSAFVPSQDMARERHTHVVEKPTVVNRTVYAGWPADKLMAGAV